MTEEELDAIKEMHKNTLDIWYDRMFEAPVAELVDMVLTHMPAGDLLTELYEIEKDIAESIAEEGGEHDV